MAVRLIRAGMTIKIDLSIEEFKALTTGDKSAKDLTRALVDVFPNLKEAVVDIARRRDQVFVDFKEPSGKELEQLYGRDPI